MKKILTAFLVLFTIAGYGQRRGQSEFFLEIQEDGLFTVSVNEETVKSPRGRFRFHNLEAGRNRVTIELHGRQLFRQDVDLFNGARIIASFSRSGGFKVKQKLPIRNRSRYNLDDWDGEIVEFEQGTRPGRVSKGMPSHDFAYLKRMVEKESFDSSRLKLLRIGLRDNPISVEQLDELLAVLSFDDARLEIAMLAYDRVVDPENYFRIMGSFRLSSSKDKLEDFLQKRYEEGRGRPQRRDGIDY